MGTTAFVFALMVSVEPSGLEAILSGAMQSAHMQLARDARLDAAARCMLEGSVLSGKLEGTTIRYCAQREAVADNLLLPALVMHRSGKGLADMLTPFLRGEASKRDLTHHGAALMIHDGWAQLLFLGTQRRGELYIEPEVTAPGDTLMFHGALSVSHDHPRALLSSPRGRVHDIPLSVLSTDRRSFAGALRLPNEPGKYQLEIMGESANGPLVICNRALFVGQDAPAEPKPLVKVDEDPVVRMLSLINESRKAHGVPPVTLDDDLSAVAELHASALRQASYTKSYFAHDSPDGSASLPMRLWNAQIRYSEAAENLAESATVEDAHETLMASPGHRGSILNARYSTVGIGYVKQRLSTGDESVIVVVDFVRESL
jgi:uncharacterized protein YkwD